MRCLIDNYTVEFDIDLIVIYLLRKYIQSKILDKN